MTKIFSKAYVAAVDMGYGHLRAIFPLQHMAELPEVWRSQKSQIISANAYPHMPTKDRAMWFIIRKIYEVMSRFHGLPVIGTFLFSIVGYFERIPEFYPRRDMSHSILPLYFINGLIRLGFGKHFVNILNENPLPLIVSFPIVAFIAERHGYKGEIYCLCTDTDIARPWVPTHPEKSRIHYLAPTVRVRERLKVYGVRPQYITVTGFPLPADERTIRDSVIRRITKLDPLGHYRRKYRGHIALYLGQEAIINDSAAPLTILFAIGGAGAQTEVALQVMKSLASEISAGSVRLILAAGTSASRANRFHRAAERLGLDKYLGNTLLIVYEPTTAAFFRQFNVLLPEVDVLWTKPSELSFYAALGLPIIMSAPLGIQEECNRSWLHMMGAGFEQYDPRYANEWLFDWIESGWLAEATMSGYVNAPKHAVSHIEKLVLRGERSEIEDIHFI